MDEMDRRNVDDPTVIGNDVQRSGSVDDRDVTAKPIRGDEPTTADYVGEAAGGISGGLAGAAIGSLGGPVGTLVGGLAGVIGGWWAGRSIAEAAKDYGDEDDRYYRSHYESGSRLGDRNYDDVRPAYQLGHLASRNPDYSGRDFDTVESDLRRGWSEDIGARHGNWDVVRGYAREGYTRGGSMLGATSAGSVDSTVRTGDRLDNLGDRSAHAADRVTTGLEAGLDNIKDRVDGNPASKPGLDPTDARAGGRNFAERAVDTVRGSDDRLADTGSDLGDAARRGTNKVIDAVDNVKDRVDGNPASKPGPDPTDRRF